MLFLNTQLGISFPTIKLALRWFLVAIFIAFICYFYFADRQEFNKLFRPRRLPTPEEITARDRQREELLLQYSTTQRMEESLDTLLAQANMEKNTK